MTHRHGKSNTQHDREVYPRKLSSVNKTNLTPPNRLHNRIGAPNPSPKRKRGVAPAPTLHNTPPSRSTLAPHGRPETTHGQAHVLITDIAKPAAPFFLPVALILLSTTGCRTPPAEQAFLPIGLWYRVADDFEPASPTARNELSNDLATIHELGFNTLFICPDAASHTELIASVANEQRLTVTAPPIDLDLQAGSPSTVATDQPQAAASPPPELPSDEGESDDSHGQPSEPRAKGGLATISVLQRITKLDAPVAGWLNAYHRALAAGKTQGFIFDAFRSSAPGWAGIVTAAEQIPPRRAAAVKRVTERARHWGLRLRGATTRTVDTDSNDSSVAIVHFSLPNRRYLMLWNRSPTGFARRTIPIRSGLGSAKRLVGVPTDERTIMGNVLTVRTQLAPGDAVLYEVF